MASFNVQSYRPKNYAMDYMRQLFSGMSLQLQKRRMDEDRQFKLMAESRAQELHKSRMKLNQQRIRKDKQLYKNAKIDEKAKQFAFASSVVGGYLSSLQNGLTDGLYSMNDIKPLQTSWEQTVKNLKKSELVPDKMVNMLKPQGDAILLTKIARAQNFEKLNKKSPYKVNMVKELRGFTDDQVADLPQKDFNEIYLQGVGALRSRHQIIAERSKNAKDHIDAIFEDMKNVAGDSDKKDALNTKLKIYSDRYSKLSALEIDLRNKLQNVTGVTRRKTQQYLVDTAKQNRTMKQQTLVDAVGGMESPQGRQTASRLQWEQRRERGEANRASVERYISNNPNLTTDEKEKLRFRAAGGDRSIWRSERARNEPLDVALGRGLKPQPYNRYKPTPEEERNKQNAFDQLERGYAITR